VKDELIATELIFENTLTELPPEEIIALFSALVFELKTDIEVKLGGTLEEVFLSTPLPPPSDKGNGS
jgi:superfamily II RNA helicase